MSIDQQTTCTLYMEKRKQERQLGEDQEFPKMSDNYPPPLETVQEEQREQDTMDYRGLGAQTNWS